MDAVLAMFRSGGSSTAAGSGAGTGTGTGAGTSGGSAGSAGTSGGSGSGADEAKQQFAEVDVSAWPVVVIRYFHITPTDAQQSAYFSELATLLNERASEAAPCALVFDASAVGISLGAVSQLVQNKASFLACHAEFTRQYYDRFQAVCAAFGVVADGMFRQVIKLAIAAAPPTRPCLDFGSVHEAVEGLRSKV